MAPNPRAGAGRERRVRACQVTKCPDGLLPGSDQHGDQATVATIKANFKAGGYKLKTGRPAVSRRVRGQ